jgi:hypothetical protein
MNEQRVRASGVNERITAGARALTEELEQLKGQALSEEQRRAVRRLYQSLVDFLIVQTVLT